VSTTSLPIEEVIELYINGKRYAQLLCTPTHLTDLAIGLLASHGIITEFKRVVSIAADDTAGTINIRLPVDSSKLPDSNLAQTEQIPVVETPFSVVIDDLPEIIAGMHARFNGLVNHAGMHCGCLVSPNLNDNIVFRYDVGRHNVVDKLIGTAIRRTYNLRQSILAISGRISSEIVIKAARAGIPVIITEKSITTLATVQAEAAGIALVGRINRNNRIIAGASARFADV